MGPDTILLQCHDVTLTFKVATQIFRMHIVNIATYSCTKFHASSFNSILVIKGSRFLANRLTDGNDCTWIKFLIDLQCRLDFGNKCSKLINVKHYLFRFGCVLPPAQYMHLEKKTKWNYLLYFIIANVDSASSLY